MIDCKIFTFAVPPRVGTTWCLHVFADVGVGEFTKTKVHMPWCDKDDAIKIRLSVIRHPADWLFSYWNSVYPGNVGVPCVDIFRSPENYKTFEEYVLKFYLSLGEGSIGRMFDAYQAHSVIKIENIAVAMQEFLFMVTPSDKHQSIKRVCRQTTPQCVGGQSGFLIPKYVKDLIMKNECEFCERYDYYL